MEIHAPERHVQSLPEIALHLAIVTIGILIALGLEQTVEWYRHRELAAEARETILNEIRSNRQELSSEMPRFARHHSNAVQVLDFMTDMLDRGKSDRHGFQLTISQARLRNTSWSTAQTVGALSFMPYAELEKYASIYRRQDDFLLAQNRTEDAVVGAYSVFAARNVFEKLSHAELEAERGRLMATLSALTLEMQIADGLIRSYDALLSGKPAQSAAAPSKQK